VSKTDTSGTNKQNKSDSGDGNGSGSICCSCDRIDSSGVVPEKHQVSDHGSQEVDVLVSAPPSLMWCKLVMIKV
jgi:hypothetical protein